ncbi:hypothetical protein ACFYOV_17280 [Streptomyces sp. NPDC005931]|uniref:hypothetical protein n=1 Tax=Streptomyces sp. NPDC005931 TaxID=3364737 RepID=UPI0036CEDC23
MARRVALWLFRCTVAVLVVVFAVRAFEETAIAGARDHGRLDQVNATVVSVRSQTHEGCSGTGQDKNCQNTETWRTYDLTLLVGTDTKSVSTGDIGSWASFSEGGRVRVGLWHGKVIEIEGHGVWHPWGVGTPLVAAFFVLYLPAMGYLVSLAVTTAAWRRGRNGRAGPGRDQRVAANIFGVLAGLATGVVLLLVAALRQSALPWWPVVPVTAGAAVACALLGLSDRRRERTGDTPPPEQRTYPVAP